MPSGEASERPLEYDLCRYGASRIVFRGPKQPLDDGYVAIVGGSEAYGKYVEAPFPALLQSAIEEPVVNLGVMHAGLTLIVDDPEILKIAAGARLTVVQVLGAQNMSNRFYSVHPRRNDRFVSASERLQNLFPEIDFTEFNFTGHLLSGLQETGRRAFDQVIEELQTAWVSRMRLILNKIDGDVVLLWMSERRPEDKSRLAHPMEPMFVTREMLEEVSHASVGIIEIMPDSRARADDLDGKVFVESERQAAAALPGPRFHADVAHQLADVIAQPGKEKRAAKGDAFFDVIGAFRASRSGRGRR